MEVDLPGITFIRKELLHKILTNEMKLTVQFQTLHIQYRLI
jgi:hypothetical protein